MLNILKAIKTKIYIKFYPLRINSLIISGFIYPSQVNSHVGSQRACFDISVSVTRTSCRFLENDPIPTYRGGEYGGGKSKKSLRRIHSGAERHKGPKGKKRSDLCHFHFIKDGGRERLKKHFWKDDQDKLKCMKTGSS